MTVTVYEKKDPFLELGKLKEGRLEKTETK